MDNIRCCAIVMAAGSGQRMGADVNKVFLPIGEKPAMVYAIEAFERCSVIEKIIIVTREIDVSFCENMVSQYGLSKVGAIVKGGETRQKSVKNGLFEVGEEYSFVAVHDGARILVSQTEIEKAVEAAAIYKAAAVGVKAKDTLKQINEDGFIECTIDRERTYCIQTPQVFDRELILNAHEKAEKAGYTATDDAALVEFFGERVKLVEGFYDNIKLTTPEDIAIAHIILKNRGLL